MKDYIEIRTPKKLYKQNAKGKFLPDFIGVERFIDTTITDDEWKSLVDGYKVDREGFDYWYEEITAFILRTLRRHLKELRIVNERQ